MTIELPPVPFTQERYRAIRLAIARRLGLDPEEILDDLHFDLIEGEHLVKIHVTALLPADDVAEIIRQTEVVVPS